MEETILFGKVADAAEKIKHLLAPALLALAAIFGYRPAPPPPTIIVVPAVETVPTDPFLPSSPPPDELSRKLGYGTHRQLRKIAGESAWFLKGKMSWEEMAGTIGTILAEGDENKQTALRYWADRVPMEFREHLVRTVGPAVGDAFIYPVPHIQPDDTTPKDRKNDAS